MAVEWQVLDSGALRSKYHSAVARGGAGGPPPNNYGRKKVLLDESHIFCRKKIIGINFINIVIVIVNFSRFLYL